MSSLGPPQLPAGWVGEKRAAHERAPLDELLVEARLGVSASWPCDGLGSTAAADALAEWRRGSDRNGRASTPSFGLTRRRSRCRASTELVERSESAPEWRR